MELSGQEFLLGDVLFGNLYRRYFVWTLVQETFVWKFTQKTFCMDIGTGDILYGL